jgi:hypothetical protein
VETKSQKLHGLKSKKTYYVIAELKAEQCLRDKPSRF